MSTIERTAIYILTWQLPCLFSSAQALSIDNQCAEVKGRMMFDAIRTIYNIIKYIKVQQMHGLMVVFNLIPDSLSFFSVEHSYNNYNNNNNNKDNIIIIIKILKQS